MVEKLAGRVEEHRRVGRGSANEVQIELAILVALTSIVFPALTLIGLLWILLPLKLGKFRPLQPPFSHHHCVGPWTLMGVFMLGVLIAFVKLGDLATVVQVSLFAFAALILFAAAAIRDLIPLCFGGLKVRHSISLWCDHRARSGSLSLSHLWAVSAAWRMP